MNIEKNIQLEIETPAIGKIYMEIPHTPCEEENSEFGCVLQIPNRKFVITDYTKLDLSFLIESDVEKFKKLNSHSDENHQIDIDTLCVYGLKISGNYIRIQYWFDQFGDDSCHRMCAGALTHTIHSYVKEFDGKVYPDCYSSDVTVYW